VIRRALPLLALLAMAVAGCAGGTAAPAVRLTATLAGPTHVTLRWQGVDRAAAGTVVEFATEPAGEFAVLEFEPPGRDTLDHPDLMPDTTFYYRVRPYYGPASATVAVALPPGAFDENAHRDDPDWGAPRTLPGGSAPTGSVRVAGQGVPADLRATVVDPNGIRFTWTDHARDEDGYLVEVRRAGAAEFRVAAVLDPDVNAYGLVTLPEEKRAEYRVRAFSYGPPSNLAHQTTGPGD
jgi:hypothetical protein